ncbi:hypothetical protein HOY80DRAFT_990981, partial [Tuber brumale]
MAEDLGKKRNRTHSITQRSGGEANSPIPCSEDLRDPKRRSVRLTERYKRPEPSTDSISDPKRKPHYICEIAETHIHQRLWNGSLRRKRELPRKGNKNRSWQERSRGVVRGSPKGLGRMMRLQRPEKTLRRSPREKRRIVEEGRVCGDDRAAVETARNGNANVENGEKLFWEGMFHGNGYSPATIDEREFAEWDPHTAEPVPIPSKGTGIEDRNAKSRREIGKTKGLKSPVQDVGL